MRTVSLGILAALAGLALSASVVTGQGAQQGAQGDAQAEDVQPLKQVKLTDRKIQGYIAAQKQLAPLTDKLEAAGEKADPALDKQIEQIAKSNGFASTEELGDVSANISIVMAGLDAKTGQFTEPPEQIRQEMAEIKQDNQMSQQDKDRAIAQMQKALKVAAPLKFKENVTLVKKYQKQLDEVMSEDGQKQPGSGQK
jgi:hypothetical protein